MSAFVLPLDEIDPVGFALSYPFERPAGSFVFRSDRETVAVAAGTRVVAQGTGHADGIDVPVVTISATVEGETVEFADRIPVLASGSNAAPAQLGRKYRDHPEIGPILVQEVEIEGLASVYSAHVARYGSVAATLLPCPSFAARLHLLFVPPDGFAHLNRTESVGGNYLVAALDCCPATVAGASIPPLAYLSRRGPARFDGHPRRLPGTGDGDGAYEEATQEEIQRRLHALMEEVADLPGFVTRLIGDAAYRAAATERLAATTSRVVPQGARILAGD